MMISIALAVGLSGCSQMPDPASVPMGKTRTPGLSVIATSAVATASPNNVANNPTWFVIDRPFLYSISKGSYKAENNDVSVLDIFLIGKTRLELLSSTQVGVPGVQVRGIDHVKDTLYLADWGGVIYVYDIANRKMPSPVSKFSAASDGGIQMLHVINSLLCVPHWNGKIDFYSLQDPRKPRIVRSFDQSATSAAMVQMLPQGDYVWCIGYACEAGRQNLHCFDLRNPADPLLVSSSVIPQLTHARYGVIDAGILYAGGFADASRVCAIDLQNPQSPSLLKTFSFNLSSLVKVGNQLIGPDASGRNGTCIIDITDWNKPVSSCLYPSALYYPRMQGDIIFAFNAGSLPKPPEAAPNDSPNGETLLMGHWQRATVARPPGSLPRIPEPLFGVNQYNVGRPQDLGRYWPLTDADAAYLKSLGCNSIRFPLYPHEVGIDEKRLVTWAEDGRFDPAALGAPDWRSLDAIMDWMVRHQFTPNVCPSPEVAGDWTTKTWMSLHVPENAEPAVWFTRLVVEHLTAKYGDQILYGWYENWWWNSYKHEKSTRFPQVFRQKLAEMYGHKIGALNQAWNSAYRDFHEVEVPRLMAASGGGVDPAAVNSRRTFDLRQAMDLLHRDVLRGLRDSIKRQAPGAKWIGGCLLNSIGALDDIRSTTVPSCAASMRTAAGTGDFITADLYSDSLEYYSHYRTLSKFAATAGTKLFIAEVPVMKPRAFKLVADVGGPSAGAMAWCGREDVWGLIKGDGSPRIENGLAWRNLHQTYTKNRKQFAAYKPGTVRVYFPEETLAYSVSAQNHIDAFNHICDYMMPEDLELVLTDELGRLPRGARIFVLERTLPARAIATLAKMGGSVFSPHESFLDENGKAHPRHVPSEDFFVRLQALPEADKLMDAFRRVEEKAHNVAFGFDGSEITSTAALASHNDVLPGRPNTLRQLIDGSSNDGATFADAEQDESVTITLKAPRRVHGAFVDYFEGDGQQTPGSRVPEKVVVSASTDGNVYAPVAVLTGAAQASRSRVRFPAVEASHIRFDFGKNTTQRGLRLVEIGVIGKFQLESRKSAR